MQPRVGVAKRCWAFYTKSGVGTAATATCSYHDEAANWTTGAAVTAGGATGWYYIDITPDAEGSWGGYFTTASDVDEKDIGFEFEVQEVGWTVAGIASSVVTAIEALLASAVTTPNGFFKLLKDNAHSAADVWSVGTRTLTSFAAVAASIWDYLTSAMTTSDSIGKLLVEKLALISSGSITVATPVSTTSSVETRVGDDYSVTDGRRLEWPATAIVITGATVTVHIKGALAAAANATFSGEVVSAYVPGLTLTSTQSATLLPGTYDYTLVVTKAAHVLTQYDGEWTVKDRII
jgi:hypothetical protein